MLQQDFRNQCCENEFCKVERVDVIVIIFIIVQGCSCSLINIFVVFGTVGFLVVVSSNEKLKGAEREGESLFNEEGTE
tara:strand:+ start:157 stop:390 length:234 start_codon:yes stop_codon:yes gene_type:complete